MKFCDKFIQLLEQDMQDAAPEEVNPDRDAMAKTLGPGVKPEDFDVPAPRASLSDSIKQEQLTELKHWISQIDNFVESLNAAKPESLQSKLHAAGCDTIFENIARSEKKKITRIAAELSTLSQSLKGYLISSND